MIKFCEDSFLVLDMIDVLALDNLVLLHRLNGKLFARVGAQPAYLNEAKGTLTKVRSEYHFIRILTVKKSVSSCLDHNFSTLIRI